MYRTWTTLLTEKSDTHLRTCDTLAASCTLGYVLGVGDTKQMFFCLPEGVVSPNIGSRSVVDVCTDRAEEGSCVVSCARGPPIEGDLAVRTCMTNDSLIGDGLPTGEPQACANLGLGGSVWSDRKGTLPSQTRTDSCVLGHVASYMCDAIFQYLALPGVPDGTLPGDVPLVCPGQEFDGSEGVAHTNDGGGLGDSCARGEPSHDHLARICHNSCGNSKRHASMNNKTFSPWYQQTTLS